MSPIRIQIVENEPNMLKVLQMLLESEGYIVSAHSNAESALALIEAGDVPNLVISDLKLDAMDGLQYLERILALGLRVPFILISAYGTIEKAVEAMRIGANDVIPKPFTKEVILDRVTKVLAQASGNAEFADPLVDEPARARTGAASGKAAATGTGSAAPAGSAASREVPPAGPGGLVYRSAQGLDVLGLIRRIGPLGIPVLLYGESGTGKELAARAIHELYVGDQKDRPFVSINCPAVPESLLESELFGYRKGAFTSAHEDREGKVAQAEGGTLFFDEIGDLPLGIQPKLLRLLENRSYDILGGKSRTANIRIVCATNRNLAEMVENGTFRRDLYYRINTFTIEMPALRHRVEDIPLLASRFLDEACRKHGFPPTTIQQETLEILKAWHWPGNVRELKNVIERAAVLTSGGSISPGALPPEIRGASLSSAKRTSLRTEPDNDTSLRDLDEWEREILQKALDRNNGNISATARDLGISRNTLRYRIEKFRIPL